MPALAAISPPILSCAAARELEARLFAHDEAREWAAMQAAGAAVAAAALNDARETGGFPAAGRVLVLVGKGHNGGDALIAARVILERCERARADVVFAFGSRGLRPLAARAWRELAEMAPNRVDGAAAVSLLLLAGTAPMPGYDLCLDGIFGFQFRPPAEPRIADLISRVNALPIRLRAAVDLPSAGLFRADFTYATGCVKEPLPDAEPAGRVRYLDLGFFADDASAGPAASDRMLTTSVLADLRRPRVARCDKRTYGHVFLLGGSRAYPGAILMAALAALRSGAGLVTAFVPESLAPSFAARLPEAIWVGWPETPDGGLALEGEHLLRERVDRADALVLGPGSGREPETLALMAAVVEASPVPVVIDADALQSSIVGAGSVARVVTPHAGEFRRIAGEKDVRAYAGETRATVVLKGPVTRVCDGGPIYHSTYGGPVLARGGSGDLLAGMIGAQLAQSPQEPLAAAARAVVWHGHAADLLARSRGQVTVLTTQLLEYLGPALLEP